MSTTARALRVVVVENNNLIRLHTEDLLKRLGYEVVGHARTAGAAVSEARLTEPDVVLMDIELDGPRDGIDAAREISETLGIPSVFVTGAATAETQMRALAVRPLGYLHKPLDPAKLEAALRVVPLRTSRIPVPQQGRLSGIRRVPGDEC